MMRVRRIMMMLMTMRERMARMMMMMMTYTNTLVRCPKVKKSQKKIRICKYIDTNKHTPDSMVPYKSNERPTRIFVLNFV